LIVLLILIALTQNGFSDVFNEEEFVFFEVEVHRSPLDLEKEHFLIDFDAVNCVRSIRVLNYVPERVQ